MNIQSFANTHRLRTRLDECGEKIIPGRYGHIYEYGSGRFGVMLMFKTPQRWTWCQKRLASAGLEITLDCDTEGTALFDPENKGQVKVAIREARIKKIHPQSPERAEKSRLALQAAYKKRGIIPQKHGTVQDSIERTRDVAN